MKQNIWTDERSEKFEFYKDVSLLLLFFLFQTLFLRRNYNGIPLHLANRRSKTKSPTAYVTEYAPRELYRIVLLFNSLEWRFYEAQLTVSSYVRFGLDFFIATIFTRCQSTAFGGSRIGPQVDIWYSFRRVPESYSSVNNYSKNSSQRYCVFSKHRIRNIFSKSDTL